MKYIAIIGLGLIGGSIATALKGFEDYTIIGVDICKETLAHAKEKQIADIVTDDTEYALSLGDVVFCCLHPQGIVTFLEEHRNKFKDGALVTDVCGVKTAIMACAECLPESVDFIGSHPMAGKERGGIEKSSGKLFWGAHYIVTPRENSRPENLDLMKRIAGFLGCRDFVCTSPERHDEIIAYTSQIMHIIAVSICDDPNMADCMGFEGGSFRDCTRVAALDPFLWTQLFSMNTGALSETIRRLEGNLRVYREIIESGDTEKLMEKLQYASDKKRRMDIEHRRGDDAI